MITQTCPHNHPPNGCDQAGCAHNPFGWVLNNGDTTTTLDPGANITSGTLRVAGLGAGSVWMSPDFDAPLELAPDICPHKQYRAECLTCIDGGWGASFDLVESPGTHIPAPMGADSTPLRRVFHEVGVEQRPGSLDIPSIEQRARRAILRGDADREGVRAMGRDMLLLIEALKEVTQC